MNKIIRITHCEDCPYFLQVRDDPYDFTSPRMRTCVAGVDGKRDGVIKRLLPITRSPIPNLCPLEDSKE